MRGDKGGCWRTPSAGGVPKNPPSPGGQSGCLQTRKVEPDDRIRSKSKKRISYASFTSPEGYDEEEAGVGSRCLQPFLSLV